MRKTLTRLKALAVKVTSASTAADVTGNTIDEVLAYMETNFVTKEKGDKGDTGAAGKSVTAIELVTTDGAVTGGTVTFSDTTTAEITVTTTEAQEEAHT